MNALPVDDLLAPLSESEPCGPDLEYDADFMALEVTARGTPERQAGNEFLPAEPPPWPEVYARALELAQRTRDLRLAVLLARAGAYTGGLKAYADGLGLVAGLIERWWDQMHPRLDASDGNDPTMRLNALAPLGDAATGLADLRACLIGKPGSGLTARLVELAWTKAEPVGGEARPTQTGVLEGLRGAMAANLDIVPAMRAIERATTGIENSIGQRVGVAGPDLKALSRLARGLAEAAAQLEGAPRDEAVQPVAGSARAEVSLDDSIGTREDVVRVLDRVCSWIERNEPTNPAPLLIRRAQRLMSKSFIDLVRDLAPDGLSQVERIAGVAES